MLKELLDAIPPQCWTILFVALAGLILMAGARIFRSKNVDVHAGSVEVHVEDKPTVPPPEQPPPQAS